MNRDEWLAWRRNGLGSSDAPIVMGVSPWCTRYQLWENKTGSYRKPEMTNPAIERDNALEPRARAQYELDFGIQMPAKLVVHEKYPWLRASLDGFNAASNRVLEIKCPGKDDHQLACAGSVPPKYWAQCQHQILVSGAERVDYYSFDGQCGAVVMVFPDMDYCRILFEELRKFWQLVKDRTPPRLTHSDVVRVRDSNLKFLAEQWLAASKAEQKSRQAMLEAIESRSGSQPGLIMGNVKGFRRPVKTGSEMSSEWIFKEMVSDKGKTE